MNEETGQETGQGSGNASLDIELKSIIADVLGLEAEQANELEEDSGLFGHLPELDSMAVAGLLTEIEDRLDIVIEDEDVDGEMLETYGGLLAFVEGKLNPDSEEG
ncbi:MAG: acyl carrier protein [Erythrobacter sp.]|uniref:acyl carrier protein n=1 Tax=Erythrobacter sp. TaxID=1042 RepID=UPI00326379C0